MGWNNIKHQPSNIKHLMVNHFVDDEHFCYFDDMYSPEYSLQWIYEYVIHHPSNIIHLPKKAIIKSCRANAIMNMAIFHIGIKLL